MILTLAVGITFLGFASAQQTNSRNIPVIVPQQKPVLSTVQPVDARLQAQQERLAAERARNGSKQQTSLQPGVTTVSHVNQTQEAKATQAVLKPAPVVAPSALAKPVAKQVTVQRMDNAKCAAEWQKYSKHNNPDQTGTPKSLGANPAKN